MSDMKPLPTRLVEHKQQQKQEWCQWEPSKEINLVPPIPLICLLQAEHFFEKSCSAQSAQYGLSWRDVKLRPAKGWWQCEQVKHSLCHGSLRYVTPPVVTACMVRQCCG